MARKPSVNTLKDIFGDNAKEARAIIQYKAYTDRHGTVSKRLWKYESVQQRIRECYHSPNWLDIKMTALNELAETHGVEALEQDCSGVFNIGENFAEYLNMGDPYIPTLIFWNGFFRVQSVGDFIEVMERRGIRFK